LWTVIEHGGGGSDTDTAACIVNSSASLDVLHVTTRACRGYGIALVHGGAFALPAAHLRVLGTVTLGSRRSGAILFDDADSVRTLPDGEFSGNANDEITIAPTADRTAISTTAQWRNPGVRYHIASERDLDLEVGGANSPTLTIAPGVSLAFDEHTGLTVGVASSAALIADGLAVGSIVMFGPATTTAWRGIAFGPQFDPERTRIRYAQIRGGARRGETRSCGLDPAAPDLASIRFALPPLPETLANVNFLGANGPGIAIARDWSGESRDLADAHLGNAFSAGAFACRQTPVRDERGRCPLHARCE
jgi:hypothetical protein